MQKDAQGSYAHVHLDIKHDQNSIGPKLCNSAPEPGMPQSACWQQGPNAVLRE